MFGLSRRRLNEIAICSCLIVIYIIAIYNIRRAKNEIVLPTTSSSLNSKPAGTRAVYLLYSRLGFRTDRLEANWSALTQEDGLLIIAEPLLAQRLPSLAEIESLRHWIAAGGTVFYSVTLPARPLDPHDPLAGDLSIVPAPDVEQTANIIPTSTAQRTPTGQIAEPPPPYLKDVHHVTVRCPVRLVLAPHSEYQTLMRDASGAVMVYKRVGRGHLIIASDLDLTSNSAVTNADNAILMVNLASIAIGGSRRITLYDEFHHGAGFDESLASNSLWSSIPVPLKLVLLQLIAVALILVYNANRRFGPEHRILTGNQVIPTDFIRSMARFYRRSHSPEIALLSLGSAFHKELTRNLGLPLETEIAEIVASAESANHMDASALGTLLRRLQEVDAGARISEQELMMRTAEIEKWQRRFVRVGS